MRSSRILPSARLSDERDTDWWEGFFSKCTLPPIFLKELIASKNGIVEAIMLRTGFKKPEKQTKECRARPGGKIKVSMFFPER